MYGEAVSAAGDALDEGGGGGLFLRVVQAKEEVDTGIAVSTVPRVRGRVEAVEEGLQQGTGNCGGHGGVISPGVVNREVCVSPRAVVRGHRGQEGLCRDAVDAKHAGECRRDPWLGPRDVHKTRPNGGCHGGVGAIQFVQKALDLGGALVPDAGAFRCDEEQEAPEGALVVLVSIVRQEEPSQALEVDKGLKGLLADEAVGVTQRGAKGPMRRRGGHTGQFLGRVGARPRGGAPLKRRDEAFNPSCRIIRHQVPAPLPVLAEPEVAAAPAPNLPSQYSKDLSQARFTCL